MTDKRSPGSAEPANGFHRLLFLPEGEGRQGEGGLRCEGKFKQSLEGKPLITVITVLFNGADILEETVLSVIHQDYENVEYIIVDGGSTDGTLDRLRQYEHAIDYWVSEKDGGIYEAMNKGVDLAQGEWIIFMNGGDRFASEHTLSQEVIPLCRRAQSGADSSEGFWKMLGFAIQYDTGEVVRPRFNALMLLHNTLHHQGLFYHHTLFEGFRYDTTQKLISDYELNLSVYLNRVSAHLSNTVVAICSDGGVSRVNADRFRQETNFIRGKCVSGLKNRLFSGLFALKLALHSRLKNTPQK